MAAGTVTTDLNVYRSYPLTAARKVCFTAGTTDLALIPAGQIKYLLGWRISETAGATAACVLQDSVETIADVNVDNFGLITLFGQEMQACQCSYWVVSRISVTVSPSALDGDDSTIANTSPSATLGGVPADVWVTELVQLNALMLLTADPFWFSATVTVPTRQTYRTPITFTVTPESTDA